MEVMARCHGHPLHIAENILTRRLQLKRPARAWIMSHWWASRACPRTRRMGRPGWAGGLPRLVEDWAALQLAGSTWASECMMVDRV
jgi:hypothetical protein